MYLLDSGPSSRPAVLLQLKKEVSTVKSFVSSLSSAIVAVSAIALLGGSASAQQFQNQTTTRFPAQLEYSNQFTVLDIDHDGDLDIVVANGQGYSSLGALLKPRIYINDGAGFFADQTDARVPGVTGCFRGVEAGDMDGDGWEDLVLSQDYNRQPLLLRNTGGGFFVDETVARLPAMTMSSARAQFGDIDNDGDLDLFFCNSGTVNRFGSGPPRLFQNNGAGVYTNISATHIPTGNVPDQQDAIFGDVDADFDLDLHITSRSSGQSRFWTNNGGGTFANVAIPSGAGAYSYDMGDIDGDGDFDLFGAQGGTDILLRNNMPAAWSSISGQLVTNPSIDDNDSKFFDYDNDGDMDLFVGSLGTTERVYVNNGAGTLTLTTGIIQSVSDASLDIKVADFTGDNRIDVITAQGESGNFQNKIYVNVTGPADSRPPTILRTEAVSLPIGTTPIPKVIRTEITDAHTSDRGFHDRGVQLNYAIKGCPGGEGSIDMDWVGNSMWRAILPAMPPGSEVSYWVTATDYAGNVGTGATQTFTEVGDPAVLGDIDGDGDVDGSDLSAVLGAWGGTGGPADLNCDDTIDGEDLTLVLGQWAP